MSSLGFVARARTLPPLPTLPIPSATDLKPVASALAQPLLDSSPTLASPVRGPASPPTALASPEDTAEAAGSAMMVMSLANFAQLFGVLVPDLLGVANIFDINLSQTVLAQGLGPSEGEE